MSSKITLSLTSDRVHFEKLLIPILDFFYGLVPSYGLAIVALTVVIKLHYISAGSIRSAEG